MSPAKKGSVETAVMRRLAWAFVGRLCNKFSCAGPLTFLSLVDQNTAFANNVDPADPSHQDIHCLIWCLIFDRDPYLEQQLWADAEMEEST